MLSPNQLERATPGYRRGYNDATSGRPPVGPSDFRGVWEAKDYTDGFKAGANDMLPFRRAHFDCLPEGV